MQELGILPEDIDVVTAKSYLPRIYKFDKILSDRTEFRGRIANWIQGISAKGADKAGQRIERINSLLKLQRNRHRALMLASEIAEAEKWSGKKFYSWKNWINEISLYLRRLTHRRVLQE